MSGAREETPLPSKGIHQGVHVLMSAGARASLSRLLFWDAMNTFPRSFAGPFLRDRHLRSGNPTGLRHRRETVGHARSGCYSMLSRQERPALSSYLRADEEGRVMAGLSCWSGHARRRSQAVLKPRARRLRCAFQESAIQEVLPIQDLGISCPAQQNAGPCSMRSGLTDGMRTSLGGTGGHGAGFS